jgi:NADPH:quinone reductase
MKALLSHAPGGPETLRLEEVPSPSAGPGQLVVDVRAVAVNYPDVLVIEDKYQFRPQRPFAPGGELSGTVREVGPDVRGFAPGDRVIALCGAAGGMAEQAVVKATSSVHVPEGMPLEEAAALLFTYGTSWYALHERARIAAGETLLVLGAAGGVGIAAVELGKAAGARVVAAVSSERKAAFAREAGADETVVYPRGPLDREQQKALAGAFKQACGDGADVVYDAVGGDYTEPAVRTLAWEGRLLVVGFPAGIPKLPLNLTLLKSCQIVGVFWGAWMQRAPEAFRRSLAELFALYAAGRIRPRISQRFPLERGGEAIAALGQREALGKLIVTIG